jgi:hypothetical protein
MPGFLIPADLDRLIPVGVDPLVWAETNLLASPGALVMKGLRMFRIPSLVPAIKPDGSCKNLTADGLCGIHENAPFGCAFFACGVERQGLANNGLQAVYSAFFVDTDSLYRRIWTHLAEQGITQQAPEVLRAKMRKEL